MKKFPDDADGDVLRSLQKKGVDLDKPREIDFYCYASNRSTAKRIADHLDNMGFNSRVHKSDQAGPRSKRYSVYSTKWMIPDYGALLRVQAELNKELSDFGTYCDGWGTLVDPKETAHP